MKIRRLLTAFVWVCAGAASAQTASAPLTLDPAVRYGVLDNGLTYYIRQNNYPEHQAEFYIAQKVGSMQEEEEQRGLAHFLEHMCFNGTEHFPGNDLVKYLETIGVKFGENLNAYTSLDETVYNISGVPTSQAGALDSCLLILHDWSNALLLATDEIDKERGVIHEEWRMGSSASKRMFERSLPLMIPDNRYGQRMPIGLMSVVDNFKPKVLRDYYHRWYRPDLQGIIVVGDINVDEMEQKIKKLFSPIKKAVNPAPRVYTQVPDNPQPIVVSEQDPEQTLTVVQIMRKHEVWPDSLKNRVDYFLDKIQGAIALSIVNERLSDLATKSDVPFAGASCEDGGFLVAKTKGAFEVTIVPKEGQLDEAVKTVLAEVYRADRYGFTESEVERVRANLISSLESAYQNKDKIRNQSLVNEYVQHFLNGEPSPGIETEYKLFSQLYRSVTLDQVNARYKQWVADVDTNLVIYAVSPQKEGIQKPEPDHLLQLVHQARTIDLGPYQDQVSDRPLIDSLPAPGRIVKERSERFGFTEWRLSNGVKVWFKPTDFKANEIQMYAFSPGGTGYYSGSDLLQLNFFGEVIGASGVSGFKQTELAKKLAGKQVSVSPTLSTRREGLQGGANPKDLKTLCELIYLSFQEPYRDDEAVASVLNQVREVLRNREADPMHAFGDSVSVALYGHHPRLLFVRPEMVDKVDYSRILEIYKERFSDASDFTFVFCGNLNVDSLRTYAEQYLATLPNLHRKEKPVDTKMYKLKGDHTIVYSEPMQTARCQAVRAWYGPVKLTLKNKIVTDMLGQILNIRYIEVIREEMGAAYSLGAGSRISMNTADKPEYMLQIYAPLKPEMSDSALLVMDQELERISKDGVSDTYLNKVKEFMLKDAREQAKKNATWLQAFCTYKDYGVDLLTDYEKVVEEINSDDIRKMAERILKDHNRATVMILPAK